VADSNAVRYLIAVVAALGVVGLLAYARNDPGADGRVADPEDVRVVVVEAS
jgi:hypothetical protein